MGNIVKDIGKGLGVTLGIVDPNKAQDKALKKANKDLKKQQNEEVLTRQSTQRAALQQSPSLFDILGSSGTS